MIILLRNLNKFMKIKKIICKRNNIKKKLFQIYFYFIFSLLIKITFE
jgi:hypothetical protein